MKDTQTKNSFELLKRVEEELLKEGKVFDTQVFAIPYARQKYEEIVHKAIAIIQSERESINNTQV